MCLTSTVPSSSPSWLCTALSLSQRYILTHSMRLASYTATLPSRSFWQHRACGPHVNKLFKARPGALHVLPDLLALQRVRINLHDAHKGLHPPEHGHDGLPLTVLSLFRLLLWDQGLLLLLCRRLPIRQAQLQQRLRPRVLAGQAWGCWPCTSNSNC